jgi:16S rRNA G527 N7-methylase RsmG
LVDLILESDEENPLFKAPIRYKEAQILDIGTGQGNWAM